MKAKELAEILLQTPEAEVFHEEYTGCTTPLVSIDTVKHSDKGERIGADGGVCIKNGFVRYEIVILEHQWK